MQGVPERFDAPVDRAEFRGLAGLPGVELYRAHIVSHRFDPHCHDGYGLGVVELGAERFRYRGQEHVAAAGSLVLMQPGELHTGGPAGAQGWRYRMLYLEEATRLRLAPDEPAWGFTEAVHANPRLAQAVSRGLADLWHAADPLSAEVQLCELLDLCSPVLARPRPCAGAPRLGGPPPRFQRALARLRDDLSETPGLRELADLEGLSPSHFQRAFTASHQVSPHRWLMAQRLADAKRRLARGEAAASVAATVGLVDQAHLTRRFAAMYGVTPARYQRQLGLAPRANRSLVQDATPAAR